MGEPGAVARLAARGIYAPVSRRPSAGQTVAAAAGRRIHANVSSTRARVARPTASGHARARIAGSGTADGACSARGPGGATGRVHADVRLAGSPGLGRRCNAGLLYSTRSHDAGRAARP